MGLALPLLLTACMAWPGPPQPVANPWTEALQACALDDDTLSLAGGALPAEALCTRARALGDGLHCLGRQMPALPAAQARFTSSGLLEFQDCLQPLAEGLMAGRLGRPQEIDLALRQCVLQLDRSPVGPHPRLPWWQEPPVAQFPPPPAVPALAQARLPSAATRSWPACDEVGRLVLPSPRLSSAPTPGAPVAPAAPGGGRTRSASQPLLLPAPAL